MTSYGIKVARQGQDLDDTDPNAFTLLSGYNTVKIFQEGIIRKAYGDSGDIGDSTTQFDITNPSGNTYRYTYDGTGTDPDIDEHIFDDGRSYGVDISGTNMSAGNEGVYEISDYGTNYFEVLYNPTGVVESNKTIGGGSVTINVTGIETDVVHNLGYKPIVRAYGYFGSDDRWFQIPGKYSGTHGNIEHIDSNIVRLTTGQDSTAAYPDPLEDTLCKYYILVDPRQDAWYEAGETDSRGGDQSQKYGIKVTRPGTTVTTAKDKDLVYSSEFNSFKICKVMYFSGSGDQVHGLDYPPAFDFFVKFDGYSNASGAELDAGNMWRAGNNGYYQNYTALVTVDETKVYATEECYVILYIDPLDG
jgi:hypothetical protein